MSGERVEPAVLVMARAPRPGSVKTRLQPMLGGDGCARLQVALIRQTVQLARRVTPAGTYLAFDPPDAAAELAALIPAGVQLLAQRGPHLGARMSAAVADVAAAHRGAIVVIGTDAPTLTAAHLREAAERTGAGVDAVLGPALDGGYYLIGVRRPMPELFAIDPELWGGPDVLAATLQAAEATSLRVGLLGPLRDLDTPADVAAFLAEPGLPADIAAVLQLQEPVR